MILALNNNLKILMIKTSKVIIIKVLKWNKHPKLNRQNPQ